MTQTRRTLGWMAIILAVALIGAAVLSFIALVMACLITTAVGSDWASRSPSWGGQYASAFFLALIVGVVLWFIGIWGIDT